MESEIDLRNVLGMMRRQVWLIVSLVVGVTLVAAIITYSLQPKYSATALLFVDTAPKNILSSSDRTQNGSTDNARVDSEVTILQSDEILLEVVQSQNLLRDDEFGVKIGLRERFQQMLGLNVAAPLDPVREVLGVLEAFRKAVTTSRRGLTYLIGVTVTSKDPQKAARLANAMVEVYTRQQVRSKVAATVASRDILRAQVDAARDLIAQTENNVDNFIITNIEQLERHGGSASVTLLRSQLAQVQADRKRDAARVQTLDQSLQSHDFDLLIKNLESDAAAELHRQRQTIAQRLASTSPTSTAALNLREDLKKIEASLAVEGEKTLSSLRASVAQNDQQENGIRSELTKAVLSSDLPTETLAQVYSLQQNAEIARNQFQNLSMRLQELDAQAALQIADSRPVSRALAPQNPTYPRKPLILSLAALLSLGLGVGLAFVREHFVGGFTSEEQVEAVLRIPLASVSPRQAEGSQNTHSLADVIVRSPFSMFAESIRRIRVAIDQHLYRKLGQAGEKNDGTIVMVSSALPNEGKSTTALSLARTYALSGKRVLLIDCDLRKPSLHLHLGIEGNTSFLDFLRGNENGTSITKATHADSQTGLTVLSTGRRSPGPTDELFMGQEIAKLLSVARRNFDYVVLDTPPIEPVVDGLYLARHADVVVFVIKWAETPQLSAKKALAALAESLPQGAPILAVLSQHERSNLLRYHSYSEYYTE